MTADYFMPSRHDWWRSQEENGRLKALLKQAIQPQLSRLGGWWHCQTCMGRSPDATTMIEHTPACWVGKAVEALLVLPTFDSFLTLVEPSDTPAENPSPPV